MAESGLSIGLPEMRSAVGFYLGFGRGVDKAWTASQLLEIDQIVNSGVRRVYYPPAVTAEIVGYEWSWLRPAATIAITEDEWEYDLPDDFGRLIGVLNYAEAEYRSPIVVISASKLLGMRAYSNLTEAPKYAAVRYLEDTAGTTGQRQEILFYPTPGAAYTLNYEYEAYSGALCDAYSTPPGTRVYPLGGMQLAELYIESCLALAETRINDTIGQHQQQFQALLVDCIARDRKRGSQRYGQMGNREQDEMFPFRRGWSGPPYPILYKGESV